MLSYYKNQPHICHKQQPSRISFCSGLLGCLQMDSSMDLHSNATVYTTRLKKVAGVVSWKKQTIELP